MKDFVMKSDWVGAALENRNLQTPAYYYAPNIIADDMAAIRARLGGQVVMSLTACPLQEMLSRLPEEARFGVVTASRSEMNMVAAWQSDHAYVGLPGLDSQLGRAILGMGHRLIAESPAQIKMMAALRGRRTLKGVILAVNPSLVMDGVTSHRGMQARALKEAVDLAREHGVEIDGLSLAWSGRFQPDRAIQALAGMRGLMVETGAAFGRPLSRLIMGEWTDVLTTAQDVAGYKVMVEHGPEQEIVIHQGGQSLFERCGVLVTKVVDTQPCYGSQRAVCDASILTAQPAVQSASGRMASIRHLNGTGVPADFMPQKDQGPTSTLVGATGIDGDVFGTVPFSVAPGDLLAIENMGAYARTMSPSGALGGESAAALLFDSTETGTGGDDA